MNISMVLELSSERKFGRSTNSDLAPLLNDVDFIEDNNYLLVAQVKYYNNLSSRKGVLQL